MHICFALRDAPIMTWTRRENMPEEFRQYWPEDCDSVVFLPQGTELPVWLDGAFDRREAQGLAVFAQHATDGTFYALLH